MYNNEQEIKDFLMAKSMEANVEPVFEDPENGIEIRLDEKSTFVLNQILEQAFIPYLAKCLAEAGYHTEKIMED
jgi:transcriptional/translational regulatory protein YebC/TACO1